jgi:hypothetical protein
MRRISYSRITLAACFAGSLLASGSNLAFAESNSPPGSCQQGQLTRKENDGEKQKPTRSEALANCDSVIRPPQVGDQEMVEPAPPVGRMPVIKPDQK